MPIGGFVGEAAPAEASEIQNLKATGGGMWMSALGAFVPTLSEQQAQDS